LVIQEGKSVNTKPDQLCFVERRRITVIWTVHRN